MPELIAAIATAPAASAIGILRLSGPGAIAAVQRVFRPRGTRDLGSTPDRALVYGVLLDREGLPIDQVLATVSRAPHSYTGEDTAELQCHGSPTVLALGLESLYAAGARPAAPGEFTQRAFLNGRLDLTQAEAVADLLDAESGPAVHTAAGQLGGALSRKVEAVYDSLTDLMAHFHAVLDYPDEDIDPCGILELETRLGSAEVDLTALLATYGRGRFLVTGIPCVLLGRTNAGKSSLLNALLGYDRAIVTPVPGTTRDTVEETVRLGGLRLRLVDTAGLRDTEDEAERQGVLRSRGAAAGAELALLVADATRAYTDEDEEALTLASAAPHMIVVENKGDLPGVGTWSPPQGMVPIEVPTVRVSAKTGAGLDNLASAVAALFPVGGLGEAGAMLTNARQAEAARRALESVTAALAGLRAGITPDAVLTDVEGALSALGELTGRSVREDVVARVFARFCVGK